VSSAHLAAGASPGLSEVEYGLALAQNAFARWMVRCMAAAGQPGLSPLEIQALHLTCHRERPKRLADLGLVLGIEDAHLLTYAVRKLERAGLVATSRAGKEKRVAATAEGAALCARYAGIRERLLTRPLRAAGPAEAQLSALAELLRSLSGTYDQAARAAATL
jgi:predicted MarR family transcription regulator